MVETRTNSGPNLTSFTNVMNQVASDKENHLSQKIANICKSWFEVKDLANCDDLQRYIHTLFW